MAFLNKPVVRRILRAVLPGGSSLRGAAAGCVVAATMLFFVVAGTGCSSVPYTGRTQLNFYSEESDIRLGEEAWRETLAQEKRSTDTRYNNALQRVGANLARAAERDDYKWEFAVFESSQINAFALPGGKVAVYSALFSLTKNDAELATVVAHEVGHAIARHGVERMSQGTVRSIGGVAVECIFGSEWNAVYDGGSQLALMLPYSRTQEYEADELGLILMAKAGYDPANAITFWTKFAEMNRTSALEEFLSTHPDGGKRLEQLRELLPRANEYYRAAPKKLGAGNSI